MNEGDYATKKHRGLNNLIICIFNFINKWPKALCVNNV